MLNKEFMRDAITRIDRLKQETINKSNEIPKNKEILEARLEKFYDIDVSQVLAKKNKSKK